MSSRRNLLKENMTVRKRTVKLNVILLTFFIIGPLALSGAEIYNSDNASLTIFGQLWLKLNQIDDKTSTQDGASLDFAESRFGVKGEHQIDKGLDGFFVLELGYNDGDSGKEAFNQREALVGLKGKYGQTIFGRTSSSYKMAGVKIDPFNDTAAGTGLGGPNFGMSGFTGDFFDDTLAYISPELYVKGLKLNAMVFIDDSNQDDHDYNLGVSYESNSLDLYIQALSIEGGADYFVTVGDEKALRVSGQFKNSFFSLGGSYEHFDKADVNYVYVTGSYFLPKGKLSLSYGDVEKTGVGMSIGYFHNLSDAMYAYLVHSDVEGDLPADDRTASSLGLTYSF